MPTKLTPEVHEKIVRFVRAGNFRETACAAAGITSRSLRGWLSLGAKGIEPYAQLVADMDQAEAEAEARDIARVTKAGDEDWRAIAWRLERKSHDRWARRDKPEVQIRTEDPRTLTREQLVARVVQLSVAEGLLPPSTLVPALMRDTGAETATHDDDEHEEGDE